MNEKKELLKKFKIVIDDVMDNYEEYTDEEKAQVRAVFQKVAELNTVLDKYDIDVKIDWEEYATALGNYFGTMYYHYFQKQASKTKLYKSKQNKRRKKT